VLEAKAIYLEEKICPRSVGSIDVRNTYLYHPKHILLPPESNYILF
jgi:hypothetical protein